MREEGNYNIKRVKKLPKQGNANLLYTITSDKMEVFYRWLPNGTYEEISVGGSSGATLQEEICWTNAPQQTVSFTKADNADISLSENRDIIDAGRLEIARDVNKGIFNYSTEAAWNEVDFDYPDRTEWAIGKSYVDVSTLDCTTFYEVNEQAIGDNVLNNTFVVKYTAPQEAPNVFYFEVTFNSWTGGGSAGGFSYTRTPLVTAAEQLTYIFNEG